MIPVCVCVCLSVCVLANFSETNHGIDFIFGLITQLCPGSILSLEIISIFISM